MIMIDSCGTVHLKIFQKILLNTGQSKLIYAEHWKFASGIHYSLRNVANLLKVDSVKCKSHKNDMLHKSYIGKKKHMKKDSR